MKTQLSGCNSQTLCTSNIAKQSDLNLNEEKKQWYGWWKKSCTSWYGKYPIIYRVLYIPGGCWGFLNHQQYHLNISEYLLPPTTSMSPEEWLEVGRRLSDLENGLLWEGDMLDQHLCLLKRPQQEKNKRTHMQTYDIKGFLHTISVWWKFLHDIFDI